MDLRARPIAVNATSVRLPAVLAILATLVAGPASAAVPDGTTVLVSTAPGLDPFPPSQVNHSDVVSDGVSATGRYVAFTSRSNGLSPFDDDRFVNVFWRDTVTDETRLLSRAAGGPGADGDSDAPVISDDGCVVVFSTSATNLGGTAPGPGRKLYWRNACVGTGTLVAHKDGFPSTAPDGDARSPSISGDGTLVAFEATGTDIAGGDQRFREIYVRNLSGAVVQGIASNDTVHVSRTDGDTVASGGSAGRPSISRDGGRVAWDDSSSTLVAGDTNGEQDVFVRQGYVVGTTTRASLPDAGGTDDNASTGPKLDDDGSVVAFTSRAALTSADTNPWEDVYRRFAGTTSLISRAPGAGGAVADDGARLRGMEDNGLEIVFASNATNLGGPTDGRQALYGRDGTDTSLLSRAPGENSADDAATGGISGDGTVVGVVSPARDLHAAGDDFADVLMRPRNEPAFNAGGYERVDRPTGTGAFRGLVNTSDVADSDEVISADGRYVLFFSDADHLLAAPDDDVGTNIYRRDVETGETVLASRADGPGGAAMPVLGDPTAAMSGDGDHIAWITREPGVPDDLNGEHDVYVRDLSSGRTELVSRSATGSTPGVGGYDEAQPSLSGDGSVIAFSSDEAMVPGNDGDGDVFVRDRRTGTTSLAEGTQVPSNSYDPALSHDGSTIAFTTQADHDPADDNTTRDVYTRRLVGGEPVLVSRATGAGGAVGDTASGGGQISADGRFVAFTSAASNLTDLDAPGTARSEGYLRDLASGTTSLVSRAGGPDGAAPDDDAYVSAISADGELVLFATDAANLGAVSQRTRMFVRDRTASSTTLVSLDAAGSPLAESARGGMSAAGTCIVFETRQAGVLPGGPDGEFSAVYARAVGGSCPEPLPDTTITAAPAASGPDTTPEVAFTSPRSGATFECSLDGAAFAACASPFAPGAVGDGAHTISVRAVFRGLLRDATPATAGFAVDTRGPAQGPPPVVRVPPVGRLPLPPARSDRVRPVVSRLIVRPKRWRLDRRRTAKSAAARRGTTFSFRVSEPAATTLRIERKRGRRWRAVVTLRRQVRRAGAVRVRFTGRVGRKVRLRPGAHRVVVVATDRARNRSAARRATFRVVRR